MKRREKRKYWYIQYSYLYIYTYYFNGPVYLVVLDSGSVHLPVRPAGGSFPHQDLPPQREPARGYRDRFHTEVHLGLHTHPCQGEQPHGSTYCQIFATKKLKNEKMSPPPPR